MLNSIKRFTKGSLLLKTELQEMGVLLEEKNTNLSDMQKQKLVEDMKVLETIHRILALEVIITTYDDSDSDSDTCMS